MIELTENAKQKIIEIASAEDIKERTIRVKIFSSGCAGFSWDLFFDSAMENDEIFDYGDEVKVVIDELTFVYADGATIDFVSTTYGAGFKVISPNVKGTCGCRSSISFG